MLLSALLMLFANATFLLPPSPLQIPSVGAFLPPTTSLSLPPPPCATFSYPPEGTWIPNATAPQLLCRDPMAPQTLLTTTFDPTLGAWNSPSSLATGIGTPLRAASDEVQNLWLLTSTAGSPASGGGTAGNGETRNLFYLAAPDPTSGRRPDPVLVYNGTGSSVIILDLAVTDGLYILARNMTLSPGVYLVSTGIAAWSLAAAPRTPFQDFPWMLGTLSPRPLSAFYPPTATRKMLVTTTATVPPAFDVWTKNTSAGSKAWYIQSNLPLRSTGSQMVTRIQPAPASADTPSFLVTTRKVVAYIVISLVPSEVILTTLPGTTPLLFQDVAVGQIAASPTPTSRATDSSSTTASSSASASATATSGPSWSAQPTVPVGESPWTTPSSVATSTARMTAPSTLTPSMTASASPSTSASAAGIPLSSTAMSSFTPSPGLIPTIYSMSPSATLSASPSASSTPSSAIPVPAGNAAASNPTFARDLGLGLGLTTGLIAVAACLLGCFARKAVAEAWIWFRLRVLRKGLKAPRYARYPTRTASVRAKTLSEMPGVLHVSMNPALVQQQTTLDILQLARQQRLEAMTTQREQVQQESSRRPLSLPRISSRALEQFKVTYAPQKAPGSSV